MTGFKKEDNHIYESVLFKHQRNIDDGIAINYCILYARHYCDLRNLKDNI